MRILLVATLIFFAGCSTSPHRSRAKLAFAWPVDKARLTQFFKTSRRDRHHGIDLAAPRGTPIYASEGGKVTYVGAGLRGFGKLIIITHSAGYKTYYAHLSSYRVKEGEWVEQGDFIAAMGRTGRATGNHLHFEIRKNKKPVNPLAYLP